MLQVMHKDAARQKKDKLVKNLQDTGSLLVAFSGGVDSTFLLAVAHEALGEGVAAATSNSFIHPARETQDARDFARERGIHHVVFESREMDLPDFVSNSPERCYHCKKQIIQSLSGIAQELGLEHTAHGANVDDLKDYRPGARAASEAGVIAPLIDVGLGKDEIRFLSREMGLPAWDKPPMACLASRIPYGEPITIEKLKMIGDAEELLVEKGFRQFRVRHHGSVARIEVEGPEIQRITEPGLRKKLVEKFRQIGFRHISVDLEGYMSGSLNRGLENERGKE